MLLLPDRSPKRSWNKSDFSNSQAQEGEGPFQHFPALHDGVDRRKNGAKQRSASQTRELKPGPEVDDERQQQLILDRVT